MKLVPEQHFIEHVSTQKYEFAMLDWFGEGISTNIHKFSLNSTVCTFELLFEFRNVFSNFEFRFNQKYLLSMRRAQVHVLQQRQTR